MGERGKGDERCRNAVHAHGARGLVPTFEHRAQCEHCAWTHRGRLSWRAAMEHTNHTGHLTVVFDVKRTGYQAVR